MGAQVGPEEPVAVIRNNKTYVYYSENVMDGYTWNYNKDPHQVIYAIFELDVAAGQTTTISAGPGGAARPIASQYVYNEAYVCNLMAFVVLETCWLTSDALSSKHR